MYKVRSKEKGTKSRNNVTVSIFAYAANWESSQTSRDAIVIFIVYRIMREHPYAQ